MKSKSEARREAILQVAREVFREAGFEAASMSAICARVGGSKATLYNYFPSKDELLLEVILESARTQAAAILELLNSSGSLREQLERFVASLLALLDEAETVEICRVAISVAGKSDVGKRFYELGISEAWKDIAEALRARIQPGGLRAADPAEMATLLRTLCQTNLIRNLLGAGQPASPEETARSSRNIVNAFLDVYGDKTAAR